LVLTSTTLSSASPLWLGKQLKPHSSLLILQEASFVVGWFLVALRFPAHLHVTGIVPIHFLTV
jgi:hypothetical protein